MSTLTPHTDTSAETPVDRAAQGAHGNSRIQGLDITRSTLPIHPDVEAFLRDSLDAILSRRTPPSLHSEFVRFFPVTSFDPTVGSDREKITAFSKSACKTLVGFQMLATELNRATATQTPQLLADLASADSRPSIFSHLMISAHIVKQLSQMEAFLVDLLTNDQSPLRMLRMYTESPRTGLKAAGMRSPAAESMLTECVKNYESLLARMSEPTIAATGHTHQELAVQFSCVEAMRHGEAPLDRSAITRAQINIDSALLLLEVQLFAIDTPHFFLEHAAS